MKNTLVKIIGLILMVVSFVAFVAKAPAFPIASENLLPWSVWFTISVIVNMVVWFPVMKLVSFSLGIIWCYAFIAGLVPDTSTASGPVTTLDWEDPDAVAEIGLAIFNGKGQCAACHTLDTSAPKGRCPDLTDIGINAANRVPGTDAKTYLIESLYDPGKYLVTGYGKIMPEVWKNPIALTKLEIEAVIAFLQSQGGEIDPTPFTEPIDRAKAETTAAALPPLLSGDPEEGKKVFIEAACISCHEIKGLENPKAGEGNEDFEVVTAPELSEIAAFNELRYLEESILKPHAQIVSGYGTVKIKANGIIYEGTLVSQDDEKIIVRTKAADGTEEEYTILLSDIDEEPIEDLSNLLANGYFTLTITPIDSDAPVSGEIVEETEDTVTLKVGDETQTVSKTDVKKQMTLIDFDGEQTVGEHVSGTIDDDEIVIIVDGGEESFDPFDIEEVIIALAYGKRLLVKSPMPDNFPILLTVVDMADLLAFLSTLTGETAEEETAPTDTVEEVTE
ncbi:c-type cytochrome [Candidatus Poribacteria bacterium]|nr:c-type cytochrome [Candidatus Poribacteria bacterium]